MTPCECSRSDSEIHFIQKLKPVIHIILIIIIIAIVRGGLCTHIMDERQSTAAAAAAAREPALLGALYGASAYTRQLGMDDLASGRRSVLAPNFENIVINWWITSKICK